jgi:hypothetical protein
MNAAPTAGRLLQKMNYTPQDFLCLLFPKTVFSCIVEEIADYNTITRRFGDLPQA